MSDFSALPPSTPRRRALWLIVLILPSLLLAALVGYGLWSAQSMPQVRTLKMRFGNWPAGQKPIRMLLATDLHVSNLGRSKARAEAVVAQINALHPDIILLGGDYVGGGVQDHPDRIPEALAPLKALKAPLGLLAVMGNHDEHSDGRRIRGALRAANARILENAATSIGPLTIGGVGDEFSHRAKLLPTQASMVRRGGIWVMLAHSPDVFPLEQIPIPLTLTGHTHCGQIALPFYGAIFVPTHFGRLFSCGLYQAEGRTLIVSGGVGTSQVPIRLFAPPDIWLIEVGP